MKLYWINAVKAICMLFVYFQHTLALYDINLEGYNSQYVTSFYVNAFFVVSGYLLFRKIFLAENVPNVLNGINNGVLYKIVIPSVFFSIVEFMPKKIIRGVPFDYADFIYETVGGGTYWFTSALVVAQLVILGLVFFSKSKNIWTYVLLGGLLSLLGSRDSITSQFTINGLYYWAWGSGLTSVIFVVAGGLYWKYEEKISYVINRYTIIPFVIFLIIYIHIEDQALLFTPYNRLLNFKGLFAGVLASYTLIAICKVLKEIGFIDYIGSHSIGFYLFSGALPTVYSILVSRLYCSHSVIGAIMVYLLSVLTSYILVRLTNKYVPYIYDMRLFNVSRNKQK